MSDQDVAEDGPSRDVERLLTFVDAIVAIAITLLILPLADVAGDIEHDESVWSVVRDHGSEFGAFVLTFAVIARLWLAQHKVVRDARVASQPFVVCLLAWSLTIVFLPFPSALLAHAGSQDATKVFYIGTLTLSSALLGLLAFLVRAQLPSPERTSKVHALPSFGTAVLCAAALGVCLLVPSLSYFPLFLLLLADPAESMLKWLSTR